LIKKRFTLRSKERRVFFYPLRYSRDKLRAGEFVGNVHMDGNPEFSVIRIEAHGALIFVDASSDVLQAEAVTLRVLFFFSGIYEVRVPDLIK
jgi:hypothetical protein